MLWTAKAWAIAAVIVLVVLVLMRYLTVWGRQFWRITGAYFTGPQSVPVWLMFGGCCCRSSSAVRLNVLFSYQSNDLYTAVQTAFEGIAAGDEAVKSSGRSRLLDVAAIFSSAGGLVHRPSQCSTCS